VKVEKSAARLQYEANSNGIRERYFLDAGILQAIIWGMVSYKAGHSVGSEYFAYGMSASVIGSSISDSIEFSKGNRAQKKAKAEHLSISRDDVHKGHIFTRRNLYRAPQAA
jgi:diphthamide biosynthesis methyltransferase